MATQRPADGGEPSLWFSRLRWRMRGEAAKVGFVLAVGVDVLLLMLLPVSGSGTSLGRAILAAVGINVVLVIVGTLGGAWALRRRDPSLPRVVAADRAAVYLMSIGVAAVGVAGIVHRPAITEQRAKMQAVIAEGQRFVERHAPEEIAARKKEHDVRRWSTNVYRVCFPTDKPTRAWCVIVRPNRIKNRAKRDKDTRPNDRAGGTAGAAGPNPVKEREER
ncbi:MAG: hypothetical protein WC558_09435 [Patulibacter sp.]